MWTRPETHATGEHVLAPQLLAMLVEHGRPPAPRGGHVRDRNDDRGNAAHCVAMPVLAGNTLLARRLILDQKRRHERITRNGLRQSPAQSVSVGPNALARRDRRLDTGRAERLPIARQIVGPHAEIDEPATLLGDIPPAR